MIKKFGPKFFTERVQAKQAELIRCIFGNPFYTVAARSAWLGWEGGTLPKIAKSIYEEGRFEDLKVLADAVEQAGCANKLLLGHCRIGGNHAKGCWVVDLILCNC